MKIQLNPKKKLMGEEIACAKCKEIKPLTAFHKRGKTECGYSSWCKECKKIKPPPIAEGFFNVHAMEDWLVSKTD